MDNVAFAQGLSRGRLVAFRWLASALCLFAWMWSHFLLAMVREGGKAFDGVFVLAERMCRSTLYCDYYVAIVACPATLANLCAVGMATAVMWMAFRGVRSRLVLGLLMLAPPTVALGLWCAPYIVL